MEYRPRLIWRSLGFTLIELMIVLSPILILVAIAVRLYKGSVLGAKEAVLRQDLFTLRMSSMSTRWTRNNHHCRRTT